ncbi:SRPBCC family protein [Actinacidiphila alni]|uniref:SRPBCC family protein n=1 Tax=Actinacidiphila alni TaxID=380248 RepID=UPI00340E7790
MSTHVYVARPTTEVFDFLADARNLALWSSGVAHVDPAPVAPGVGAEYRYRYPGRHRPHRLVCAAFEPGRRIVFRGQRMWCPLGTQVPEYGFDLVPYTGGTQVRLSVTSSLRAALLLLAPVVAMAWRRDLPADGRKFCDLLGGPPVPSAPLHAPVTARALPAASEGQVRPASAPSGFDFAH